MIEEYRRLKKRADQSFYALRVFLKPQRTDLEGIRGICGQISRAEIGYYDYRDVCIGVVLRLYSPESLVSDKRVKRGVSRELAEVLKTTTSYLSKLTDDVRERYRLIQGFRMFIDEISAKV